jgi:hypothetical protein
MLIFATLQLPLPLFIFNFIDYTRLQQPHSGVLVRFSQTIQPLSLDHIILMSTSSPSQWHSINPQTRPLTLTILELTPLALTLSLSLSSASFTTHPQSSQIHHAHNHNHTHGPAPKHRKKSRYRRNEHSTESDDETAVELDEEHGGHSSLLPGSYPLVNFLDGGSNFKDLLSHGVVVNVNGQPWTRIVAHVSEPEEDEGMTGDDEEDADWEDAEGEELMEAGGVEAGNLDGVLRRRPRRARFSLSAGNAIRGVAEPRRRKKGEHTRDSADKDRAVVVVYGLSPGKEYEIDLRVVGLSGHDVQEPLGECSCC